MSHILFLSQLLPYPPDAGPKVRSYYVLRHLAQKHRVTLLAFSRPDDTQEAVKHLLEFCDEVRLVPIHRGQTRDFQNLVSSVLAKDSFIIRRDFVPAMSLLVNQLLTTQKFDAVHSDQLWMTQYAIKARSFAPDVLLVLDEHNACFQIFQRLANRERNPVKHMLLENEWRKLQKYESNACAQFNHVVTVTIEDQNIIRDLVHSQNENGRQSGVKKKKFSTIPICVDTQLIQPIKPIPEPLGVLHLGTMFWPPNTEGILWFAKEVWPKVIVEIPQATLTIAGKNPPGEIRRLAVVKNGKSSIEVTGYLPDPQPYLERAGVFIVPLLSGGGMRVKIVDAWRWGIPIVSTRIGAEGISFHQDENILIADDPIEFSQAVVSVLRDPVLSNRLRVNGRSWVEENYDWRKIYSSWDSIYT